MRYFHGIKGKKNEENRRKREIAVLGKQFRLVGMYPGESAAFDRFSGAFLWTFSIDIYVVGF